MSTTKQLTYHFVEESLSGILTIRSGDTVATVRKQVHSATRTTVVNNWGEEEDSGETYVHYSPDSVLIVSDQHGFDASRDDSKMVSEICKDTLIALVPPQSKNRRVPVHLAVQIPFNQRRPLLERMKKHQDLTQNIMEVIGKMQTDMEAMKDRQDELQGNVQALEKERTVDKACIRALEEDVRALEQERLVDKAHMKTLDQERLVDKAHMKTLEKERSVDKARVKALEKERSVDKARIEALEKEVNTLTVSVNKLNKGIAKRDAEKERMDREFQELRDSHNDHAGWIYTQDVQMLDRIKARHLLTAAQEMLAVAIGVAEPRFGAWLSWKEALGPSQVLSERIAKAHQLLSATHVQLDYKTKKFVSSEDGMRLVSEYHSPIRTQGDSAAHPTSAAVKIFSDTVKRHLDMAGLNALMLFVCIAE